MNPTEARAIRLQELTKLVKVLANKGKSPEEIIKVIRKRAYQMAAKTTAENYVSEIIRRFSK